MRITKKTFFLAMLLLIAVYFIGTAVVSAAPKPEVVTTLSVPIGGMEKVLNPGDYINTIFKWGIGLAALLAMGQLVLGGVLYTLSAGSIGSRESAVERIRGSITGLILLIASVTLLVTINPNLINLKPLNATKTSEADIELSRKRGEENRGVEAENETVAKGFDKGAKVALSRNEYNILCKNTANELIKRIDYTEQQLSEIKSGVYTLPGIGTLKKIGFLYDAVAGAQGTDFRTVLQKAADNKTGNPYLYHCYQDAVIVALDHAYRNMSSKNFNDAMKGFIALPTALEPHIYLNTDNMAGRNSATVLSMRKEFTAQTSPTTDYINNTVSLLNSTTNKNKIAEAIQDTRDMYRRADLTYDAKQTAINYILHYAFSLKGKPLTLGQYAEFISGINLMIMEYDIHNIVITTE